MQNRSMVFALCAGLVLAAGASAQEKGSWYLDFGGHVVDPKSDNGTVANGALDVTVGDSLRPTVMVEYFVARNWGIEVLASWPFQHDVEVNGVEAATVEHLPPTVSLQYHFNGGGAVSPYVGVGVNYTLFFSEETRGPIRGAGLELDSSFGLAAHAGIDFRLNETWSLGVDARWIDIDSDVSVDGDEIGTVEIDPIAYGAYLRVRL